MDELVQKLRRLMVESGPNRKLLIALLVLVAAIVFVINSVTSGSASTTSVSGGVGSLDGQSGQGSASAGEGFETRSPVVPPSFFVHVVGQVKTPGVYSLDVGSRLFDAIVAAGGFLPEAEQASVNLARELTDGEQILVLKKGAAGDLSPDGSAGIAGSSTTVSINRASQAQLETLPGVGPALASRIIDWRSANGGFKKLQDLLNVGGIGDKLFSGLKKLISL